MTRRDQRGSATVMVLGFTAIVALVIATVVDASAAYLRHQSMTSLADAAALAAADAAIAERAYTGGPVRAATARAAAAEYLARADASARFAGLTLAVAARGDRVVVTLRAPMRLPLAPPGWGDTTVVGTSAAYARQS